MDSEQAGSGKKRNPDIEKQQPELPPWRAFVVRRYNPHYNEFGRNYDGVDRVEEVMVSAHAVEFASDGIICFVSYVIRGESIVQHMPRVFREWVDVEEIVTNGSIH